jgi:co-chaperonin GroES (HSP10)
MMSDLILPPGIQMPQTIQPVEKPAEDATPEEKATVLPEPTGYKILCGVPDISDKIDGTDLDLVRPSQYAEREQSATTVLFVLKVGPDAYKDTTRYPTGPWCKPGDFILTRTYSGTRFQIFGKEFRLINEDQVDAVVQDPRGITRA